MVSKINKFQFTLTTSHRYKCDFCGVDLYGENGFVDIKCESCYSYYNNDRYLRTCMNCWNKKINEIKESSEFKLKDKLFKERVRKQMCRRLS